MFTFLVILHVVLFLALVLVSAMRPNVSTLRLGEMQRRAKHSSTARRTLEQQQVLPDVLTFLRIKSAFLLVAVVLLSVVTYGWVIGVVVAVFVVLLFPVFARLPVFYKSAHALYTKVEPVIYRFVRWSSPVFRFLREVPLQKEEVPHFDSREELSEMITNSRDVLTGDERKLIVSTLDFKDKIIRSIMTPRAAIDSIEAGEFLGPLVLDELHALGHSRLPVTKGSIDQIVGVLHIRDLLSLNKKQSTTAEKAMEATVHYIEEDDSLEFALKMFLKTRHHLFIVINQSRETVGLVSLEDVIEALIGRSIMDEDDVHEDLQALAREKGASNNTPAGGVDL